MISNCSRDERGLYSGGQAGDQDGGEWRLCDWYKYPYGGGWNYVLHHPKAEVRKVIAELATEAAKNDNIGYDQMERYTFWQQLEKSSYRPKNIKTPCEADCSSGVAAICKAVGYILGNEALKGISIYAYTGNLRPVLAQAGFEVRGDNKYLNSDAYLYAGDILLNEGWHTCTCVTNGSKVDEGAKIEGYKFKTETIKQGDESLDVFRLKVILKARGFFSGSVAGVYQKKFTASLKKSVKMFQMKAGLKQTGICDRDTWATLLGLDMKNGYWVVEECKLGDMNNKSVLLMQEMLAGLPKKYYKGALNWDFTEDTKKALIKFCKTANKLGADLRTDGVFDKKIAQYMIG